MLLRKNGVWLFLVLGFLLSLDGCRKDQPPAIPICIGDGFGGADCVLEDGHREYWSPTKLKNSWITTQPGMELYSSWCYKAAPEFIRAEMNRIKGFAQDRSGLAD